ncbi:hypothetical protein AXG93_1989s1020 [Marchantia polymorpha subsp. ruderalis]|uniref:Cyclin-like domain-containing protein n=1 Tax=Marchantia polymorpha subsp. ruderalis TaxID=1480154 RepID=A0A176VNQ9_MARPO|nr:hypothetical protein AXG93_1989s1020 [Marchantia polymorpha subsp. ruderalis]
MAARSSSDREFALFSGAEVEFLAEDDTVVMVPTLRIDTLHLICWIIVAFGEDGRFLYIHALSSLDFASFNSDGATRVDVPPDGFSAYPENLEVEAANGKRDPTPEHLTVEEELMMRIHYEQKIQEVCKAFAFPNKVQSTAILYFKRFYLKSSVMEHHPKHIMLTCIYLSCKVEEFHFSAEELGKGSKQDPQVVLKNEMTVLQCLNFELIVYAPYRSLDGYIFDLENSVQMMGAVAVKNVQVGNSIHVVEADDVKCIDKKLKRCRNPGLQDELKKRERKGKQKQKRPLQEGASPMDPMCGIFTFSLLDETTRLNCA